MNIIMGEGGSRVTYHSTEPKPGKVTKIVTRAARRTAGAGLRRELFQFAKRVNGYFQVEGPLYLIVSHESERHLRATWQDKLWKQRPAGVRFLIPTAWDGMLDPLGDLEQHFRRG